MTRRRPLRLLLAALLALGTVLSVQSPAHASFTWFLMEQLTLTSDMCLQPADNSTLAGAAIVQEPCSLTNSAQNWQTLPLGGGVYRVQNQWSGMCLDARGGATNGTPVQQWPCNSISNERWTIVLYDWDPLISRVSGTSSHCMDTPGGASSVPGLAMQLYTCNRTAAQKWWTQ